MKHRLYNLGIAIGQLNQRHVYLLLLVVSLVLFVLRAGAPADCGGH